MIDSSTIERFSKESPTSIMVQGLMEHLFTPSTLDPIFERHAQVQYTRNLLFSQVVNLMRKRGMRHSTVGECCVSSSL